MEDENVFLSSLAFIDDDADFTNDQYIFEFCKIVLYQNGYNAMSAIEMQQAIESLASIRYTEADIIRAIDKLNCDDIEILDGMYSTTSKTDKELTRRNKEFPLRHYVDDFCDKFRKEEKLDKKYLCDLVSRYIYQRFNESIGQIAGIFDIESFITSGIQNYDNYSDEDRRFINDFLEWDNYDKNQMIYGLMVKSYDFCMINCSDKVKVDFTEHNFYLDVNVIMRVMGINNPNRKNSNEQFIRKCKEVGINLKVSVFSKKEIELAIDKLIQDISDFISENGRIVSPQAVPFAIESGFNLDFYRMFYDWTRSAKKTHTDILTGFRKHIYKKLEEVLANFDIDFGDVSFEAVEGSNYAGLLESLSKQKDARTAATDVNNVLLVLEKRKTVSDTYLISADSKLINWSKDIFPGYSTIVEYPSAWFSIITKYSGRVTGDDYAAYCKFIRLPIVSKDKDLNKKIELRKAINKADLADIVKDKMLENLSRDYPQYAQIESVDEIKRLALKKVYDEQRGIGRNEATEEYELKIREIETNYNEEIDELNDELTSARRNAEILRSELEANAIDSRVERWIDEKTENKYKRGIWLEKHRNRIVLSIGGIFILALCVFYYKYGFANMWDAMPAIVAIVVDFFIDKILKSFEEAYKDKEALKKKYTKKAHRKFKELQ